jgi:hypothetical protein
MVADVTEVPAASITPPPTRILCVVTQNAAIRITHKIYRLFGLVSEFLATDPEVPGLIPGASRFSEKHRVWNGVHSAS